MFRIKICGITTVDDALMVAHSGADAIGLNFYPKSPRFVTRDQAREIVAALPPDIVKVGLFVDTQAAEVSRTFDQLGLDLIQLHGDQPPAFASELGGRPTMRAFRLDHLLGLDPIARYFDACRDLSCLPRLMLIDAYVPGVPGGTGTLADWTTAAQCRNETSFQPLVLAGGLNPRNVGNAIRAVCPAAVDTASGVESAPGRKDPAAVAAFVAAARDAFG